MRASEERHQGEKMSINPHLWWKLKTVRVQAAKQAIFLMVLFTGMAIASKAQSVALSLGSATGAAGQSITLNLSLADAAGAQPASLQWTMTYSSADIASISVTASSALASAGKTISCSSTGSSTTCVASGLNFGIISTGTIAGVTVHLASAPSHSSVPIQFTGDFAATRRKYHSSLRHKWYDHHRPSCASAIRVFLQSYNPWLGNGVLMHDYVDKSCSIDNYNLSRIK